MPQTPDQTEEVNWAPLLEVRTAGTPTLNTKWRGSLFPLQFKVGLRFCGDGGQWSHLWPTRHWVDHGKKAKISLTGGQRSQDVDVYMRESSGGHRNRWTEE